MKDYELEDLNFENQARLRSEANIVAAKLRRHLLRAYKEQWDESLLSGEAIRLRGDPDAIDRIALEAAQHAFGGAGLLAAGDDE